MTKGRPDWTSVTLISGKDALDNLVTIAVDASGHILGVLQGSCAGALTTLATDADGRMLARLMGRYGDTMVDVAVDSGGKLAITEISQQNVAKDDTESSTWTTPLASLLSNMNRIRYAIVTMSGEAWGTFSHSIATLWAKFNATTGHKHTGGADDAPQFDLGNLADLNVPSPTDAYVLTWNAATSKWIASVTKLPLTERGSVIYRDATVPAELLHGTAGQVLLTQGHGANPSWGAPAPAAHKTTHQDGGSDEISVAALSGLLADDQHVLDVEVTAVAIPKALVTEQGDIIYASAASTPAALPHGTAGQVLQSGGHAANPSWAAAGVAHASSHYEGGSDELDALLQMNAFAAAMVL